MFQINSVGSISHSIRLTVAFLLPLTYLEYPRKYTTMGTHTPHDSFIREFHFDVNC